MATYSNNCAGCGCGPAIPEPCITPPPVCDNPQPCTEIINAECVVYTGPAITCKDSPVIPSNSSVAEALEAIVDYLCYGSCCTIPAVTDINNPDYILLCTDSTANCSNPGKLYNWFALNNSTLGDGRTSGGIVNINPLDNQINTWRVPNENDWYALALALDPLATQSPWANNSGGKVKSTTCWSLPNSAATNTTGLSIIPSVHRYAATGLFSTNNGQDTYYWSSAAAINGYSLYYASDDIVEVLFGPGGKTAGLRLRLVRPADCNESNGDFISNAYKDNSGNLYNGVVIGTLVWLTSDLIDGNFNTGVAIPNIVFDTPWATATSGAWCYANNDPSYTVTYVNGCAQVKIAFEDFLDFIPTSTQAFIVAAGAGIQVNSVVVGAQTTYTVTNTDKGSSQFIFKNIAAPTQSTITASVNNDTVTFIPGAGVAIATNPATKAVTFTNTDLGSSVVLADAGTTTHESLVNDGNGPSLATKGLKAGVGIALSATATDITITNTGLAKQGQIVTLPAISSAITITHTVNSQYLVVSVSKPTASTYPSPMLVQGVDYSITLLSSTTFRITTLSAAAVGEAWITII